MPSPQFRNVGPTVLRHGRLGDAVQAPIWLDAAPCRDHQTFVTQYGVPQYRNVGPTVLRQGRRADSVQSPIWLNPADAHDDQSFFVPNIPALCDVGPMVLRQGRKRSGTQSPIWLDRAAPQDDQTHWLFRAVPNPNVGPVALRRNWNPLRSLAARLSYVPSLGSGVAGTVEYIGVSDSSPITTVRPEMNTYLFGQPHVKLSAELVDDDGALVDPSTVQLRIFKSSALVATVNYPDGAYLGQRITRSSVGRYAFKVMSPAIAAWEYAWDTTGPIRLAESGFRVIARKH